MIKSQPIKKTKAQTKQWIGLAALALPTLLLSIDTSVLYLALPRLSIDLKANSTEQLWIMDIYGFMIAGFLITMGSLGDRHGYRKLLIIGSAAFGIASIMAAFSTSSIMLIVARSLMGIAGATLMPSTLALIRNMFVDPGERGTAISIWMSCFMVGMIAGPLVGGTILEHFWWGAAFLLGVPIMMIVVFTGNTIFPEFRNETARQINGISVTFSIAEILPFIYGLTEFSRNNITPISIVSIIIGILFGVAFIYRERAVANPLLDVSLFKNRIFSVTLCAMLLTAVVMGGVALFMAQYLQLVMELSPFNAGLWLIPQAIGMMIGSMVVPMMARTVRPGFIMTGGFIISAVGMLLLTAVPVINGLALMVTGFVVAIIGVSPILILGTGIIIGSAPPEKAGAAASISETSNQLGVALGVALLGSIVGFIYHKMFLQYIPEGMSETAWNVARESLIGATSAASGLENQVRIPLLMHAKNAFLDGFHAVAIVGACIFALLALLTKTALSKVKASNE